MGKVGRDRITSSPARTKPRTIMSSNSVAPLPVTTFSGDSPSCAANAARSSSSATAG